MNLRRDLFHVKSFAVQKVAHVMPSIYFRFMIYLSFRSIIPQKNNSFFFVVQCENIPVYDRVIIRWHKKLRRNDKEIKAKKILGYRVFFLGRNAKCLISDDREEQWKKLLSAD